MTRRDRCHFIGRRANTLTRRQAAVAWFILADRLEHEFGYIPQPKYKHLITAIRQATISAKQSPKTKTKDPTL